MRSVYGVVLLLVGLLVGSLVGILVLSPILSPSNGAGRDNQVQVSGSLPSSLSGTVSSIEFSSREAPTPFDTTTTIDSSGHFSVILLAGISYTYEAYDTNGRSYCGGTLYVPTGTTSYSTSFACS